MSVRKHVGNFLKNKFSMSKSVYYTHQASKKKNKQNRSFLCHVRFNRKTKNKKVTVTKVVAKV